MLEIRNQEAYALDRLKFKKGPPRPSRYFCWAIIRPDLPVFVRIRGGNLFGHRHRSGIILSTQCLISKRRFTNGHTYKLLSYRFQSLPPFSSQRTPTLGAQPQFHSSSWAIPFTDRSGTLHAGGSPMTPSLSAPTTQPMSVPFHDSTLSLVDINGEPFVVMKTVIEAMGLDWSNHCKKLQNNKERWGMVKITIPSGRGFQKTLLMPLRKFTGWVQTINHNRVKNSLRHKILVFQREGDDCLWDYWSKGKSVNPRLESRSVPPIEVQPAVATVTKHETKTLPLSDWAGLQEELNGLLKLKCQVLEGTFRKRKPSHPVTNHERQQIAALRNQGLSLVEVARRIKRNPGTIRYHFVQVNPIESEVSI